MGYSPWGSKESDMTNTSTGSETQITGPGRLRTESGANPVLGCFEAWEWGHVWALGCTWGPGGSAWPSTSVPLTWVVTSRQWIH